jgi:hypothetical protein
MRAGALLPGLKEKADCLVAISLSYLVPRRGLGHTSATPAGPACPAFLVLAQCAQAHCFLGQKEKADCLTAISLLNVVPRRGLGHTSATPAGPACPAFLVLAQCAQAHCFLG